MSDSTTQKEKQISKISYKDSFESFDENNSNILYDNYSIEFPGHNSKKTLLSVSIQYEKS